MVIAFVILFVVCVVGLFVILVKNPRGTVVKYLSDWKYRVLRRLQEEYVEGLKNTLPNSYDTFRNRAYSYINSYITGRHFLVSTREESMKGADDLIRMLAEEPFVHYYFTHYPSFTGEVYCKMYQDYQTGEYLKGELYSSREALKKILPVEIASSERALDAFMKFVEAGWFDKQTGMYNTTDIHGNKINNNQIGRAILAICQRDGFSSPKVFAPFWAESKDESSIEAMEKRIREWQRTDKVKDVERIDRIVNSILES